jgi:hypothetical protein
VLAVPLARGRLGARGGQPLERVLAHGLEDVVPVGGVLEQALIHERVELVFAGAGHRMRRRGVAAADEHAATGEQLALAVGEQGVAPVERRAQGLLALRDVARAVGGQLERRDHLCGRELAAARGGELDRQRQSVEPGADVDHRGRVVGAQLEAVSGGSRADHEEVDGLGSASAGTAYSCSP